MPRFLRKPILFTFLFLLSLVSTVLLVETSSGAAEPRQTNNSSFAAVSNSTNASTMPVNHAGGEGEVQVIITTYQNGRVFSQVVANAGYSSAATADNPSSSAPVQPAAAGDIVISQIYASGGNPGSTFQNNYLELYNRTNDVISINGWPFYFAAAAGPFNQSISFVSSRGIAIGPGQYFLMRFGPPSVNGAPLPNPDITVPSDTIIIPGLPPIPPVNLSPSGKVFLTGPGTSLGGTTCPLPNSQIVDFVGYGSTANCSEGGTPVATLSSTTAALRQTNGCTDTDNNGNDFAVGAPTPRNTSSPLNFCSSAPPHIQFSQANLSDPESSGSFGLTVTRIGNTSGASSVDYFTSDASGANNCDVISGNASSRCDYIASIGTLQFAPGETLKIIAIPIVDDSYAEGTETFSVTLNNPTAATLGAQATTTITLNDNENTNGTNQIDNTGFFVRQHYIDFLNREPDNAGNTFWNGEINNCSPKPQCTEIKRINVSAAFFLSIEFQETGYLASRAYKAAYGDATGQAVIQGLPVQIPVPIIRLQEFLADSHAIGQGVVVGAPNYLQLLESNKVAFFAAFVTRQRFLTDYPLTMTAPEFVDKLNSRAGHVLSSDEQGTLIIQLQMMQKTRAEVVRAVAEDADLNNAEKNRAFVLMQYFGYLRRNPNDPQDTDYTGYKFWLDKLNQFNGNFVDAEMVKAFITSTEYHQRFGP